MARLGTILAIALADFRDQLGLLTGWRPRHYRRGAAVGLPVCQTVRQTVRQTNRRQGRPFTLILGKTGELFTHELNTRREAQRDPDWLGANVRW